jgi:hypothetical protein
LGWTAAEARRDLAMPLLGWHVEEVVQAVIYPLNPPVCSRSWLPTDRADR